MPQPLTPKYRIVWPNDTFYFLTNSTYLHYPYFREEKQKQIVLNFIKKLKLEYGIPIQAFSIAINHFHLMFYAKVGKEVGLVKNFLKGNTTREYRRQYNVPYKNIWGSTKVLWMKDEKMLYGVQGYVNGNLLKHREESNFQGLCENPFSSFKYYVNKYGFEYVKEMVLNSINVEESADGEVDVKKIKKEITACKQA